ncbi:ATP-dependent DNA helicase RecQ [Simiduia agarivorans SA1 = DSM 21679]|uniref:DNA helicase RecQ n=1 Tax=Simiduia agarivorans (strain DSM 21679 / JCM 13881 / BCRC 17597 / SA1) TaxID=1117647 RepID=K4KVP1_SIMAS|nr:ATP-dependent DNA helicase RecQ [Simiduia agarivorans SA1 = DSM 21679]
MSHEPLHILQHTFGYSAFRPPQDEIIDTVTHGGDALVIMPTGGGKSLCYQIPSLARAGCGVVISPLIALMQDQVDALAQLGVSAGYLNSTLSPTEQASIEQALVAGELDLLYIAPERLNQARTINLLHQARLALFAIDEAHCVSQWGHDFRADYLQLGLLAEEFPDVPRIALTATADARTQQEIIHRLHLEQARAFIVGFDRPNIQYRITPKNNPKKQLVQFLRNEHPEDSGIVYCLSRKKTEEIASHLQSEGFNALPYHAGLPAEVRASNQARFLREDQIIMVATVAFGMGIDKPDVRFVAHLDLPKSLEAYYQETGRAGRDGNPATAWMTYGYQDVILLSQMMAQSDGSLEHKIAERQKLDAMLGLCEVTSCRRQVLLNYFGERDHAPCGNCDTCLTPVDTWDGTEAARKALSTVYRSGQRFGVSHLVDILLGKSNDKIIQFDHQQLSTYGIGAELDANQWRSVFRQLVARGYLAVDTAGFGGLKLDEKCRALLKGEETIELRRDVKDIKQRKSSRTQQLAAADERLWNALRATRKRLAEEHGVPPYVVFHDATLMEMVRYHPTSEQAMLAISGVGESKLAKFGQAFLDTLCEFDAPDDDSSDTLDGTLTLLRLHMTPAQIAAQRGLTENTIYNHMAELIQSGQISLREALDINDADLARMQDEILAYDGGDEGFRFKPVYEALDGAFDYGTLKCVRAAILTG